MKAGTKQVQEIYVRDDWLPLYEPDFVQERREQTLRLRREHGDAPGNQTLANALPGVRRKIYIDDNSEKELSPR
jgi:hypothetical protein